MASPDYIWTLPFPPFIESSFGGFDLIGGADITNDCKKRGAGARAKKFVQLKFTTGKDEKTEVDRLGSVFENS